MTYPSTTIDLNGKTIIIETGHFGAQASGCVTVRSGDTVVLASVVVGKSREGIDYFPLTIEYQEKLYAGGVISSSRYIKREGRPSENEILTGRVIDRSLRPLFDQSARQDVQILVSPLSIDGVNEPEILGVIAASAAVSISKFPWNGPVGSVRVGQGTDGKFIVNPLNAEKALSPLDLVISGPLHGISMVESGAREVTEETMVAALKFGEAYVDQIVTAISEFATKVGKTKITLTPKVISDEVKDIIKKEITNFDEILKNEATKEGDQLSDVVNLIAPKYPEIAQADLYEEAHEILRNLARKQILDKQIRPDGRSIEDIRHINIEVGVLPRTHGSALFQRGLTHVLSVVTLASPERAQTIDGMKGEETKTYMHHYNMPGYASGEVGRPGTGRREIGHGALAERALVPVLPDPAVFPYTIRVVSEVMSSNGSTSQASVCGSTLSLMDAGVPLKKPVAGCAMGLITEGDKYITLTDISGLEDHLGDMDFKVAGTRDGITALQMDVKVPGVTAEILTQALDQAKKGRLEILDKMILAIPVPRTELSIYAPRIVTTKVAESKIGEVIGSGGKVIRAIQQDFQVDVSIDDFGTVTITGVDQEKVIAAREYIESLVAEIEVGQTYMGRVVRIEAFGAFVNVMPGRDGLVHISQIQPEAFKALRVGDQLEVRCYQVDDMGRVNLTTLKEGEHVERQDRPEGGRPSFGGRDGSRGGQGGGQGGRPPFRKFRDSR